MTNAPIINLHLPGKWNFFCAFTHGTMSCCAFVCYCTPCVIWDNLSSRLHKLIDLSGLKAWNYVKKSDAKFVCLVRDREAESVRLRKRQREDDKRKDDRRSKREEWRERERNFLKKNKKVEIGRAMRVNKIPRESEKESQIRNAFAARSLLKNFCNVINSRYLHSNACVT